VCVPTYEYECQSCHRRVEAVQSFTDPALTNCEHCGGDLRKVFSAVGIVFKGSGFYKNDNRAKPSSTPATASSKPAEATKSAGAANPAAAPASSTSNASTPASD